MLLYVASFGHSHVFETHLYPYMCQYLFRYNCCIVFLYLGTLELIYPIYFS